MRSGSWSRQSVSMRLYYSASSKTWTITFPTSNGEQDTVSHGAVIKGNFRDANSWSFNASHAWHETGQSYVRYSNGDIQIDDGGTQTGQLPALSSGDVSNDYNRALAQAYGRIYGEMNVAVDIAEWKQARDMLNATKQAEDFFIRRAPLLRKAGSLWLQYVYGWRPLAQTVWQSAYELQNRLLDRVLVAKGRSSSTQAIQTFEDGTYVRAIEQGTMKTRSLVVVRYQENGIPPISRWMSLNPLSIAWELTPYSFVVDWFYNIGGYMQDFERALLLKRAFAGGFVSNSTLLDVERVRYSTGRVNPGYTDVNFRYVSRRQVKTMSRTVLTAPPLPRPPVLNTHLGSGRLLNAAGLLSQLLGRR